MPRGPMRNYGRKVVLTQASDTRFVFDRLISEESAKAKVSPFGTSDSSHTSSVNFSLSLLSEPSFSNDKKPTGRIKASQKQKQVTRDKKDSKKQQSHQGSFLFHEDNSNNQSCALTKKKKQRNVLKEIHNHSQRNHKNQKSVEHSAEFKTGNRYKHKTKGNSISSENVPDFDAIEQDELFIDTSTPEKRTGQRMKHSVIVVSPLVCNVSQVSDTDMFNSCRSTSSPLYTSLSNTNAANITFRNLRRNNRSGISNLSKKKHSPDSDHMSDKSAKQSCEITKNSSKYYSEADSFETRHPSANNSMSLDVSLDSSYDIQELARSLRATRLRSREIAERLGCGFENSVNGNLQPVNGDGNRVASMSGDLFEESMVSDDPSDGCSPLPQIEEEDICSEEMEDSDEERTSEESTCETDNESREGDRIDESVYELVNSMSFSEKLASTSLLDTDVTVSAREKVFGLCGQSGPISFSCCITARMMSQCVKIGEGVYGEVFRTVNQGEHVALKIIPIEGEQHVNDCPQKKFDEILPEMVIAKELSDLRHCQSNQSSHFCQVNRISCVQGQFPSKLLEQWDLYSQNKVSENDRPDMFTSDQLFIVFEFGDGGSSLETYSFENHEEALSVLRQVVFSLAVAENELEFEHRDLHIGNVLVKSCDKDQMVTFRLQDKDWQFPSNGVVATIIDFTISRLKKDGCAVFCDVSTDEGLFQGKGDFQFDVYRDMRLENGNDWQSFCPHSNVLWANYLCRKFTSAIKYKDTSRTYRDIQRHVRSLVGRILDYPSCVSLAIDNELWEIAS